MSDHPDQVMGNDASAPSEHAVEVGAASPKNAAHSPHVAASPKIGAGSVREMDQQAVISPRSQGQAAEAIAGLSSSIDAGLAHAQAAKRAVDAGLASAAAEASAARKKAIKDNRPQTESEWLHDGLSKILDPKDRDSMMAQKDREAKKARLDKDGKLATLHGSKDAAELHAVISRIDATRADFKAADEETIKLHDRQKQNHAEDRFRNRHPGVSSHRKDGIGGDLPLVESTYDDGSSGSSADSGEGGKRTSGNPAAHRLMKEQGAIMRNDGSYVMLGINNSLTQPDHQGAPVTYSLATYYTDPFQFVAAALQSGVPRSKIVLPKDCGYTLEQVLEAIGHGGARARRTTGAGMGTGGSPRSPTRTNNGSSLDYFGYDHSRIHRVTPAIAKMAAPMSSPSVASFRRRAASSSPMKRGSTNMTGLLSTTYNSQGLLRDTLASISRKEAALIETHEGTVYQPAKHGLSRDTNRLHVSHYYN
jgi:hypothetical protein